MIIVITSFFSPPCLSLVPSSVLLQQPQSSLVHPPAKKTSKTPKSKKEKKIESEKNEVFFAFEPT